MGFFSNKPSASNSPNPFINAYSHLASLERADEALKLLHQLASMVKPIMRKRSWKVGTLAEFLPDYHALQGLNTNFGQIINIRLRPAQAPNSFYDMETLMETMLHELVHNVFSEHDKSFYSLLDELKKEWDLLSSKGYQGEGFFSQGQRLGSGHMFYKPSMAVSAADKRQIKLAAERRARGEIVSPEGKRLGGPDEEGRLLGGETIEDVDPRHLAAIAAEQRANDQNRCGAKHPSHEMKRETERAHREGTTIQVKDIGNVIDLNDIQNYDLDDLDLLEIPQIPEPPVPATKRNTDYFKAVNTKDSVFLQDWACSQCTFMNPRLFLSCEICQSERAIQGTGEFIDLAEHFGISWDCRACTFKNENVLDGKCIVCGTEV